MAEKTRVDRYFSIPGQKSPPAQDVAESLAWVVVRACDFEKVNQLAESLQIQQRPDRADLIRKNHEKLMLEASENLDLQGQRSKEGRGGDRPPSFLANLQVFPQCYMKRWPITIHCPPPRF